MNRDKWTTRSPGEPLSMKKIPSCMYVYVTNARRIHRERETSNSREVRKQKSNNDESWIEIYIWNTNKCMYVRAVTYRKKTYACRPVAIGCVDVESGRRIED